MLMLIPPSTQQQAHLKFNPECKTNGKTEAKNNTSKHLYSHMAISPTSRWGLGMIEGREVWLGVWGGQRNLSEQGLPKWLPWHLWPRPFALWPGMVSRLTA